MRQGFFWAVRQEQGSGDGQGAASGKPAAYGTWTSTNVRWTQRAGADEFSRLDRAVNGLLWSAPDMSAAAIPSTGHLVALAGVMAALATVLVTAQPWPLAAIVLLSVPFTCITLLRIGALWHYVTGTRGPSTGEIIAGEADEPDWPGYTVLVPLYREANVIPGLLYSLDMLDYPRSRLQILLIAEASDRDTLRALQDSPLPPHMRVVTVPAGLPRTKPRALNYALTYATGDYVVVFDAEDAPDPHQLKIAVRTFRRSRREGSNAGCVQARLDIYTLPENFLTRQFTLEYLALFGALLPAYEAFGFAIPLGGTSNHFPLGVLQRAGAWDPYNVTEDADLGLRLARMGYGVLMIPSVTWEEAPVTLTGWLNQRRRWMKGWLQTYFVHARKPGRLFRDLGLRKFAGFHLIFGGVLFSSFMHPLVYVLTGMQVYDCVRDAQECAGGWVAVSALFNLVACYTSGALLSIAVAKLEKRRGLVRDALLMPGYWLLQSVAAYLAFADLLVRPHHWFKTAHTGAGRSPVEMKNEAP